MISRIQVLGYKAFKYIDVRLSNFNILVGPNASGKSTFFDVLTLLKEILDGELQQALERRCGYFKELTWEKKANRFEISVELSAPQDMTNFSIARYEIAVRREGGQGTIIEQENLWLIKHISSLTSRSVEQPEMFPKEPEPPEHIVQPAGKRIPAGWRKVISKSPKGNDWFRSEITDWNIMYSLSRRKSSLAGMPEDPKRFPLSLWVKSILRERIRLFQLNSLAMKKPCRPDAPISLQVDGSNLPKVAKFLKNKSKEAYMRWTKHVQTALPLDVELIGIKREDRFLYIYVRSGSGLEIPSWLLSDGTLRLLAQTLLAYLPDKNNIYMVEEPENGLHPLAIESVFQSLSSVYDNQVLLATHSPHILRLAEPEHILCFSKTQSGAVDIVRGIDHPKLKDWRRGIDLATLHAAGVLQ
jgi:predicted ATPase